MLPGLEDFAKKVHAKKCVAFTNIAAPATYIINYILTINMNILSKSESVKFSLIKSVEKYYFTVKSVNFH